MVWSLYQIKESVHKMGIKLCMLHQATSTTPFLTPPDSVISSPQKYKASHQAHSGKISVKKAKLALDKMAAKSADISSKVCKSKSVISKVDETR